MGDTPPQFRSTAWPLRYHLLLLVVGALLPIAAFSVIVIQRLASSQQAAAERRLVIVASDMTASLDRELAGTIRGLDALALSGELARRDFPAFRSETLRAITAQPSWRFVVLRDSTGKALVNTRFDDGLPLPSASDEESIRRVVQNRQPVIGSLVYNKQEKLLAFPVRVPIIIQDQVRYVLTAAIEPTAIDGLVAGRRDPSDEWSRGIVDSHGTVIARTRDPERYVGKPGSPTYLAGITADEGFFRSVTLEGKVVYSAYSRSKLSGWTCGIAVPASVIDGPVRHSILTISSAGLAMLVLSTLGAIVLSRSISRGIVAAASSARSLAQGQRPRPLGSTVIELASLDISLRQTAELLAERERQRNENLSRADAARADAEAASRAKDEFLAMLGHELRNPLGPIRTGVHLLSTLPPDDARLATVKPSVERQITHLSRIVDDLLDASRIARGIIRLDRRPLNLSTLVSDVATDFQSEFTRAGISLLVDLPKDPVPVNGDPTRLAQSLGNLLHNSLKFTPAGGSVQIRLTTSADQAHLAVSDSGSGISSELLPKLFVPFSQAQQSLGRTHGGLGLGLALLKGFVSLHGGTVEAQSPGPSLGTTVTLHLPLTTQPLPTSPSPRAVSSNTPRKVLVIEDMPDAARTLKVLLAVDGHTVRIAHTAAEALFTVTDFTPDVIVCDIGLPDMDGYELCRQFRQLPSLAHTYLIALTGYGQAEDIARATAAGFHLHLTKPVDVQTLRAAIAAAQTF